MRKIKLYNVAVVGAGGLGRRHIEGLINCPLKINLFIVDKSIEALKLARELVEGTSNKVSFKMCNDLTEIDAQLDLVILATTANNRFGLISSLVDLKVPHIIAEKVLFNSIEELGLSRRLKLDGTKIWVNCPRRLYPVYKILREEIRGYQIGSIQVKGVNYGMACNGIHFIDLISFLCGDYSYTTQQSNFEQICESKREGFVEIFGTYLGCFSNGVKFELTCQSNENEVPNYQIRINFVGGDSVVIDELRGTYSIATKACQDVRDFKLIFQSHLTTILAGDILTKGDCDLTPFLDSISLHEPFVRELYKFYSVKYGENENGYIPIT